MKEAQADLDTGLIYLKDQLAIDSQVRLFSENTTGDRLEYKENDSTYIQLFPLHMAIDLTSDSSEIGYHNPRQLAERLLAYHRDDT